MTFHRDTPDHVLKREEEAFAELVAEARLMTEIGMSGADVRDQRTKDFLEAAFAQTSTDEELKAYIKKWWKG